MRTDPAADRLITPAFAVVTASAMAYFVAIGILIPALPVYVEDELGGDGTAVGLAVGSFAVSAALLRPVVGRIGDVRGRRVLVIGGGTIAGLSILGYHLATSLAALIGLRLVTGVGEAAIFVGAATAVQDMAPAARRGEAASYFSVAVYGGLGLGPLVGEVVRDRWGFESVWTAAALTCAISVLLATRMGPSLPAPADGEPVPEASLLERFFHPAAVRPGVILALSATGFAGFAAFVPLYVDELGLDDAALIFFMYSACILVVRIFGAKLPDRLGPVRAGSLALALQAVGFGVMASVPVAAGLYAGTLVYSLGVSLLYPALLPLVIAGAPESERSQAVATFTLFFDISQGLGAFALGAVVAIGGSERWAFAVAGVLDVIGFLLLRARAEEARRLVPAVP